MKSGKINERKNKQGDDVAGRSGMASRIRHGASDGDSGIETSWAKISQNVNANERKKIKSGMNIEIMWTGKTVGSGGSGKTKNNTAACRCTATLCLPLWRGVSRALPEGGVITPLPARLSFKITQTNVTNSDDKTACLTRRGVERDISAIGGRSALTAYARRCGKHKEDGDEWRWTSRDGRAT